MAWMKAAVLSSALATALDQRGDAGFGLSPDGDGAGFVGGQRVGIRTASRNSFRSEALNDRVRQAE
jgi:hypothetical protein